MVDAIRSAPVAAALVAVLALGACATRQQPAPVVFRGSQPGGQAVAAAPAAPAAAAPQGVTDGRGVVDYGGYRAVIAQPGDTLDTLGQRAGVPGSALAAYNGYPAGYLPRPGEEVILPPDAPATPVAAPAAPTAVAAQPLPAEPASPTATASAPAPDTAFDLRRIEAAIDTPAPPAPAPAPAPATVAVPELPPPAARTAAVAPDPARPPAPPAAAPAPQPAAAPAPARAPAAAQFVRPVSGEVVRGFSPSGASRSDGMEFAAPAGTDVVAAAPGQVALVSEALGGDLGTVILVRHADQILTVYGRVASKVAQGQRVQQGEVIGTVAPAPGGGRDSLHFEVRRGTEPVDPAPFFGG